MHKVSSNVVVNLFIAKFCEITKINFQETKTTFADPQIHSLLLP